MSNPNALSGTFDRKETGRGTRLRRKPARARNKVIEALAVLFILTLPFSSVSLQIPLGNFAHNAALPFFLMLVLACLPVMRQVRLPAIGARDPAAQFLLVIILFFGWCAFTTLITGVIFEYRAVDAFGHSPFAHSVARFPIPVFLGFVVFASFFIARFILPPRRLDGTLLLASTVVTMYGLVQFYSLQFQPEWYTRIALLMEGARTARDHIFLDYVTLKGRLNLTTYEAAEGARLVLILLLPALLTMPLVNGFARALRVLSVLSLIVFIFAAETLVGLAGLAILTVVIIFLEPSRQRSRIVFVIAGFGMVAFALLPGEFLDRIRVILTNPGLAQTDPSTLTRAAFVYASLDIALDHPLLGIGWSKDIFFMHEAIPDWGLSWEVVNSITSGEAVAAKSLAIRLLLYGGLPAFGILTWYYVKMFLTAVSKARQSRDPCWRRLAFVLATFGICGIVDGGILSTLYPWAAIGLALGSIRPEAASGRDGE
ncbi:hypothetical protein GR183_20110 [Stappia sp. GBMRC 2046]|uniref:O-antigen ligase-related domain-containing protein n=1 Tax=Stappia sediminis TaxID=2692190 RepID=A0A7X3LY64_9HYPH|nr:O-antigen ligase family protein [Stappia sediminis]MXN67218.1 hypothetical protein [Stappia sediminis]